MQRGAHFVFGYGSLLTPDGTGGFVAALPGFRRGWGVAMDNRRDLPGYKYYTDPTGRRPEVFVAFLDLSAADGATVDGLCRPVTGDELELLDARERNYVRVDVSDRIPVPGARVWTYVGSDDGRERLRIGRAAGTAVIDATYRRAVEAGFARLGLDGGQLAACRASLDPDGIPVVALVRHELA